MIIADILLKKYKKVLLVDDDEISNTINKFMLEHTKFTEEVVIASSADKALDYLNQCDENDLPEVIFLDIEMPGKTGWDFTEEIKNLSLSKNIKIVVLTSSIAKSDQRKANEINEITAFVSKPLSPTVLGDIQSRYLEAC